MEQETRLQSTETEAKKQQRTSRKAQKILKVFVISSDYKLCES